MKEKKELLFNNCKDLLYEEAFNLPYDIIKTRYTGYEIKNRLDNFLTKLIEDGELFYGKNFVNDFLQKDITKKRSLIANIMDEDFYFEGYMTDNQNKKWTEVEEKKTIYRLFNKQIKQINDKLPSKDFSNIAQIYLGRLKSLEDLFKEQGKNFFSIPITNQNPYAMYFYNYFADKMLEAKDLLGKANEKYQELCEEAKNFTFENNFKDVVAKGFNDTRYWINTPGTYREKFNNLKKLLQDLKKEDLIKELEELEPVIERQEAETEKFARKEEKIEVEEPVVKSSYEELLAEIVNDYNWPEKAANQFIADNNKDEEIRKKALAALAKLNEEAKQNNEIPEEAKVNEDAKNIPVGMKPIVSREPKKKLLDRFKEKWQNPSFRKKVIIGGVAVVLIGGAAIALAALNPDFVNSISQGLNYIGNNISHLFGNVPDTQTIPIENVSDVITSGNDISAVNTINAVQGIDMSNVSMEGLPIYNSAVDAANSLNQEVASQFASSNIQGLFDVGTNQIVPLSPEDLQNFDKIQELVQNNQNLVPYTGNGELNTLNDVSGFFNVEDIVNHVGRSR